jgi:hypothetical protein
MIMSALSIFYLWVLVLQFTVGVYSIQHNVACDQPLSAWLVTMGTINVALDITFGLLFLWIALHQNQYHKHVRRRLIPTLLQVLAFVLLGGFVVTAIAGNVWYSRATAVCKATTPVAPPTALMLPLYQTCSLVIFFADAILIMAPLFCWCGWERFSFLWARQPLYPWRGVMSDVDGKGAYSPLDQNGSAKFV